MMIKGRKKLSFPAAKTGEHRDNIESDRRKNLVGSIPLFSLIEHRKKAVNSFCIQLFHVEPPYISLLKKCHFIQTDEGVTFTANNQAIKK